MSKIDLYYPFPVDDISKSPILNLSVEGVLDHTAKLTSVRNEMRASYPVFVDSFGVGVPICLIQDKFCIRFWTSEIENVSFYNGLFERTGIPYAAESDRKGYKFLDEVLKYNWKKTKWRIFPGIRKIVDIKDVSI